MKKKGQESLSTIALGELIFGLTVCAILLLYVNYTYQFGSNFREAYLEKETNNMLNIVKAANGDLYVRYPMGKYDYNLEFEEGSNNVVAKEQFITGPIFSESEDISISKEEGEVSLTV